MICKDCGKEFNMAPGEVKFYEANHLKLPKRCLDCRATRKTANEAAERQRKWKEAEKRLCLLLDNFPFSQTNNLEFNKPDQSLVVIGNGFDIMHGVKSSYWDFQKTIGKKSSLRYDMETYLDVPSDSLWYNLEDSLGRLNYSMFLRPEILDMWLDAFGAYNPDAQAADFFAAVETAIGPTFTIPQELKQRFKKWIKKI